MSEKVNELIKKNLQAISSRSYRNGIFYDYTEMFIIES